MIKTNNQSVYDAFPILKNLASKEMPVKTSFKLATMLTEIMSIVNVIESERYKIGEKHGKLNEDGTEFKINAENIDNFKKDIAELSAIEITINADKILLPNEITISATDLILVKDFVNIEE